MLQTEFGTFEQSLGFVQLLRSDLLGTSITSCLDGLTCVAHFLHGRTRTCSKTTANEQQHAQGATVWWNVKHGP